MSLRALLMTFLAWLCFSATAQAQEYSYTGIAERFGETQLDARSVTESRMQGECLVGLKQLIFVKREDFDPIAEWINYRTFTLLEQFPPCNVLIMMEVARNELMQDGAQP